MARPNYDVEIKREVIAFAVENGFEATYDRWPDLQRTTVRSWCSRAGMATSGTEKTRAAVAAVVEKRRLKREELRTLMIEKAVDLVNRMDEPHIDFRGKDADQVTFPKAPAQACQQYATAAAILLDKFRLELGEATGRTEIVDQTREAAKEALDELAQRRTRVA